jgi:prevent-host-death family protein
MSTVNMRELSRNTKSVIEDVVRSGRPAIITVNGRPQVAVAPLAGAVEAVEEHVLRNAPAHIEAAIRDAEADLISGRVSLVDDDSTFGELDEGQAPESDLEIVAAVAGRLNTEQLKEAIRTTSHMPDAVERVREALAQVDVLTLGRPAGRQPRHGSESDVVTYAGSSEDGYANVVMPIFTSVAELRTALGRNPTWQALDVLELNGKGLVENVDPDVTIAIDPWSSSEFLVPPTSHRTLPTERAVLAAADLMAIA